MEDKTSLQDSNHAFGYVKPKKYKKQTIQNRHKMFLRNYYLLDSPCRNQIHNQF